jgi:hypothetical protein
MAPPAPPAPAARFVGAIVDLNRQLRFGRLPDALREVAVATVEGYGDGLVTLAVPQRLIPSRYLTGIFGFRLAQFLRLGMMCPELAHRHGKHHEPIDPAGSVDSVHAVTIGPDGALVGYICLVGSVDPAPLPLDHPARYEFPAEQAHRVRLLDEFARPGRSTHQAYEIKRFVRSWSMEQGPTSDRVPWHLILALSRVVRAMGDGAQVILGDSREDGALRHLRLLGFDPVVIDDTRPQLTRNELMWPSYEQQQVAKPFAAAIPEALTMSMGIIEAALAEPMGAGWQRRAVTRLLGAHPGRRTRPSTLAAGRTSPLISPSPSTSPSNRSRA